MERMLPQNVEAEASVLGSLLIDPDALTQVMDFLKPEHFYRDAHRSIYETIMSLYNQREAADYLTVSNRLELDGKIEAVGGHSYIISLVNRVPTSANVEHYGRIVENLATLRHLIHAGTQIVATAYTENDADAALQQAEELIFSVQQQHMLQRSQQPHIYDILQTYMDALDRRSRSAGDVTGVPTGFDSLDRLLGGLQPSDLIILAARPAVGKTSFALSIARHAAMNHRSTVGVFSLEMSQDQLVQRLLSMDSGVDQQLLRLGKLEGDDWNKVMDAQARLQDAMLLIDDTASISPALLRSKVRKWISDYGGLHLIIVDYLQLMQPSTDERRFENRVQVIDEISRQLKALARELNIPVLALAQLSRALEARQSKVPQLSDLRESGSLEQNSDVVMFIYRDELYNPESEHKNCADIIIAKHRNGPTGEVRLHFDRALTCFSNLRIGPVPDDSSL